MSALAHYFISKNINVSGYDKVKSEITQSLHTHTHKERKFFIKII